MFMISMADICEYIRQSAIEDKTWSMTAPITTDLLQDRCPEMMTLFQSLIEKKVIKAVDDRGLLTAQFDINKLLIYSDISQILLILQWMNQVPQPREGISRIVRNVAEQMLLSMCDLDLDKQTLDLVDQAMQYLDTHGFYPVLNGIETTQTEPVRSMIQFLDNLPEDELTIAHPLHGVLFLIQGLPWAAYDNMSSEIKSLWDGILVNALAYEFG